MKAVMNGAVTVHLFTVAEMRWISFKLAYDLSRLLYIFWLFEWKMAKIFHV